tara:strand:+ start:181 stop:369 length:189 start_codon:yes stop_codon:yes gene_type:complete
MKRSKNPCINICDFSSAQGWCYGCGRSRVEAKSWNSIKPYARQRIEKQLKKRLFKLSKASIE